MTRLLLIPKGLKVCHAHDMKKKIQRRHFFILEKIHKMSFFMIEKIHMAFLQA